MGLMAPGPITEGEKGLKQPIHKQAKEEIKNKI
jgi:hypothetical protein